jgi:hypothetical protein
MELLAIRLGYQKTIAKSLVMARGGRHRGEKRAAGLGGIEVRGRFQTGAGQGLKTKTVHQKTKLERNVRAAGRRQRITDALPALM